MGKTDGFLTTPRENPEHAEVAERLQNFNEIYKVLPDEVVYRQSSRCMECGVPFCHSYGCPLGNLIPEWNDLLYHKRWQEACERLHETNNFPEITGRICPALCESACTLGVNSDAVSVRQLELSLVEKGWSEGWIQPRKPSVLTGKKVAVVGSGPSGLACAQQLARAGHSVTVFESAVSPGGILRYGIPNFKLEKWVLDRRINQMKQEGVAFETQVLVGRDYSAEYLRRKFDAVCLCIGAMATRDLKVPGRELSGVHFAMEFLGQQNRRLLGENITEPEINAKGKQVVIIGGGDTGSDCLGTSLRQGAASVYQFELLPKPPVGRDTSTPWPQYPYMLRSSSSHEEGGVRRWCINTVALEGKGKVEKLKGVEVKWGEPGADGRRSMSPIPGSEFEMACDLVLIAMGFTGPVKSGLIDGLGIELDQRGNVKTNDKLMTSVEGVFAAGDSMRGASLVVHAFAGGRRAARNIDEWLMGETCLPDVPQM